jgi:hypothetical protein
MTVSRSCTYSDFRALSWVIGLMPPLGIGDGIRDALYIKGVL